MEKGLKNYIAVWAILLVLFNVIVFVTPAWGAEEKYTASFWIGYVLITLAFAGQLACAYLALREDDRTRLFYNISLVTISYSGLIASFVAGGLCMTVPALPVWVGVILCAVVLAFSVIAVIKASAAIDLVSAVDDRVKADTLFVRSLTADAESLMARAQTPEAKAACKKVWEAVRYADPMSNSALAGLEAQITLKFNAFAEAVSGNAGTVGAAADELVILIGDRNKKCRLLK